MKDLDILFLGRLFPREFEQCIKKKMKTGMADAANALQWNIISGLETNECGKLKILNYLPVDSYPRGYKDIIIREFEFNNRKKGERDINVGHLNLMIIKHFTNIIPYRKKIKCWAKKDDGKNKVLFLYSAQPLSLKLAKYVKKTNKNIDTICLIADIPEYNTIGDLKGVRKLYNNYEIICSGRLYEYVDKFILLTQQMADKLKIRAPFMVMEGIVPDENVEVDWSIAKKMAGQKYVLYSGTLNYKFGIRTLLEAFSKVKDDNLRLVICGFGEAEQIIKEAHDSRVVFLGKIDRSQVLALQRQATVLVNPRQNNEEFTKYSFPSKTMEYLASGVPVIAYKLDGIPNEYDEYINYLPDDSPTSMANEIKRICGLKFETRKAMGEKAKAFVLDEKNSIKQAKKILDFICSDIN